MAKFKCFFDGCCVPKNPFGGMGYGWAVMDGLSTSLQPDRDTIEYGTGYKPASLENSANTAEYLAFIGLVEWLLLNTKENDEILIFGDSKLVVEQMNGAWRIKEGLYVSTALDAELFYRELTRKRKCTLKWIPRERNSYADELSRLDVPEEIEIFLPEN